MTTSITCSSSVDTEISDSRECVTPAPPAGRPSVPLFLLLSLANRGALWPFISTIAVWRDHPEVLLANRGIIWRKDSRPG